jgi:hypothetical protein
VAAAKPKEEIKPGTQKSAFGIAAIYFQKGSKAVVAQSDPRRRDFHLPSAVPVGITHGDSLECPARDAFNSDRSTKSDFETFRCLPITDELPHKIMTVIFASMVPTNVDNFGERLGRDLVENAVDQAIEQLSAGQDGAHGPIVDLVVGNRFAKGMSLDDRKWQTVKGGRLHTTVQRGLVEIMAIVNKTHVSTLLNFIYAWRWFGTYGELEGFTDAIRLLSVSGAGALIKRSRHHLIFTFRVSETEVKIHGWLAGFSLGLFSVVLFVRPIGFIGTLT